MEYQYEFEYYIFPEVFRDEVCKGYDAVVTARALADAGMLIPDKTQLQVLKTFPGMRRARYYHITGKIFDDGELTEFISAGSAAA